MRHLMASMMTLMCSYPALLNQLSTAIQILQRSKGGGCGNDCVWWAGRQRPRVSRVCDVQYRWREQVSVFMCQLASERLLLCCYKMKIQIPVLCCRAKWCLSVIRTINKFRWHWLVLLHSANTATSTNQIPGSWPDIARITCYKRNLLTFFQLRP